MPFKIKCFNDAKNFSDNIIISYNYVDIPIYINQFENIVDKDGFIKIPYVSNTTEPNVTINNKNVKTMYKTKNLYIIKSQNLIEDLSYSAELIVEHKSMTNDKKLYTCFLLTSKTELEQKTNIDDLIIDSSNNRKNVSTPKQLLLQNLIVNNKKDKTIFYESNNNSVIILTNPFEIQSTFGSNFISLTPKLFDIDSPNYKIIVPKEEEGFQNQYQQSGIEGFTKNMYCQPVDMTDLSGGGITTEPELSIPLDGNYIKNASTSTLVKTAINFCAFVLILGLCYVIIPIVYNDYIIGLIEINNAKLKLNRIRSIDIYTCFVFIFLILGLISRGVNENNISSIMMGFFTALLFIISFIIIQSRKITTDWLRMTFNQEEPSQVVTYYTNISVSDDFFNFIYENFNSLYQPITNILLFFFVYTMFILFLTALGSFKDGGLLQSGNGFIYILLFTIYLTILIQSVINKPAK